jgi:uncharacterized membrane protein YhhN
MHTDGGSPWAWLCPFLVLFTLSDFLLMLQQNKQLVTALSIPCLLLNVVIFTLYINGKKDKTAKGIFLVSVIYAIGALLFKWFF